MKLFKKTFICGIVLLNTILFHSCGNKNPDVRVLEDVIGIGEKITKNLDETILVYEVRLLNEDGDRTLSFKPVKAHIYYVIKESKDLKGMNIDLVSGKRSELPNVRLNSSYKGVDLRDFDYSILHAAIQTGLADMTAKNHEALGVYPVSLSFDNAAWHRSGNGEIRFNLEEVTEGKMIAKRMYEYKIKRHEYVVSMNNEIKATLFSNSKKSLTYLIE